MSKKIHKYQKLGNTNTNALKLKIKLNKSNVKLKNSYPSIIYLLFFKISLHLLYIESIFRKMMMISLNHIEYELNNDYKNY